MFPPVLACWCRNTEFNQVGPHDLLFSCYTRAVFNNPQYFCPPVRRFYMCQAPEGSDGEQTWRRRRRRWAPGGIRLIPAALICLKPSENQLLCFPCLLASTEKIDFDLIWCFWASGARLFLSIKASNKQTIICSVWQIKSAEDPVQDPGEPRC